MKTLLTIFTSFLIVSAFANNAFESSFERLEKQAKTKSDVYSFSMRGQHYTGKKSDLGKIRRTEQTKKEATAFMLVGLALCLITLGVHQKFFNKKVSMIKTLELTADDQLYILARKNYEDNKAAIADAAKTTSNSNKRRPEENA